jgi:hypothetical protein
VTFAADLVRFSAKIALIFEICTKRDLLMWSLEIEKPVLPFSDWRHWQKHAVYRAMVDF